MARATPTGTTLAISVNNQPTSGGGNAYRPWVSENGRYVVFDSDGNRYLDGVSSLWCNIHGHRVNNDTLELKGSGLS